MICLDVDYLVFILLDGPWVSWFCGLVSVISFVKFSAINTSNISSTLFSPFPSDISATHILLHFWNCPEVHGCSDFFFFLFSLYLIVWEVSIDIFSISLKFFHISLILSSLMSSLLMSPSKVFLISVTVFFISRISFWVLKSFSLPAYITHLFVHAVFFFH